MKAQRINNEMFSVFGTLNKVERMNNSINGNPRYLVAIQDEDSEFNKIYVARTRPDASLGYSIDNYWGKRVAVTLDTYYGKLSVVDVKPTNITQSDLDDLKLKPWKRGAIVGPYHSE
jgi:hypothetical protein